MREVALPEARLSEDGRSVHLCRGGWSSTFPVEELDRWLAFYRDLQNRAHGKFAKFYGPTVAALERVRIELGGRP